MYAPDLMPWINAMREWGPGLTVFAMILFAAQRAWVAYLKHRGAEYVLALAEYLKAHDDPTIRMRELNIIDRMIDNVRRSLENESAEIARREKVDAGATESETAVPPGEAKKAA